MKYYVARDKNWNLWLYCEKPIRSYFSWMGKTTCKLLDQSLFLDLKWEDEPIEVEMILKEVGK